MANVTVDNSRLLGQIIERLDRLIELTESWQKETRDIWKKQDQEKDEMITKLTGGLGGNMMSNVNFPELFQMAAHEMQEGSKEHQDFLNKIRGQQGQGQEQGPQLPQAGMGIGPFKFGGPRPSPEEIQEMQKQAMEYAQKMFDAQKRCPKCLQIDCICNNLNTAK